MLLDRFMISGVSLSHLFSELLQYVTMPPGVKTIVSDFDKSFRENMLKIPPYKLRCFQGHCFPKPGPGFLVVKGDISIFQMQDTLIADGGTKYVLSKIFKSIRAPANGFGMNNPVRIPGEAIYGLKHIR